MERDQKIPSEEFQAEPEPSGAGLASVGNWADFRKVRELGRARVNVIIFGGKDQKLWTQG